MNDLYKYFLENDNRRVIHKWMHYFDIYDKHFSRFRGKEIVLLEIGVYQGGSLQMWKNYFGDNAKIYGLDIDPRSKFEEENIEVIIGSQSDPNFLNDLKTKLPKFDILIDDGSHMSPDQITSFEFLYDHIKDNGVYLCEDLHSSYQNNWNGGLKRPDTFIEFSKNMIDWINVYHNSIEDEFAYKFAKSTNSIHYYNSILVLEKGGLSEPPVSDLKGYHIY